MRVLSRSDLDLAQMDAAIKPNFLRRYRCAFSASIRFSAPAESRTVVP
jgi:hypothetical protein